jgi:hypothetical protein
MSEAQIKAAQRMKARLQEYILNHPAFRSKPVGADGSAARLTQTQEIWLEDAAKQAIADFEGALK